MQASGFDFSPLTDDALSASLEDRWPEYAEYCQDPDADDPYEVIRDPIAGNFIHSQQSRVMHEFYVRALRLIESNLQSYDAVVDIGCWAGCLTTLVAKSFPKLDVYGIDRECGMLEILEAQNKLENLNFCCANIESLACTDHESRVLILSCFGNFLEVCEFAESISSIANQFSDAYLLQWSNSEPPTTEYDEETVKLIDLMEATQWVLDPKFSGITDAADDWGTHADYLLFRREPPSG